MALLLATTPAIKSALEIYHLKYSKNGVTTTDSVSGEAHNPNDKTPTLVSADSPFIPKSQLLLLSQTLQISLSKLTQNTSVYTVPAPAPPPKTKEYLALMKKLRLQEEERQYLSMIGSVSQVNGGIERAVNDNDDFENLTPGQQVKKVNEQLTTIFNIAISVFSVAFALWYWSANYSSWSLATRTLLSLFAAILTLVAETVVYLGYQRKVKEAAVKERKKVEKKSVISTIENTTESEKIITLDFTQSSSIHLTQSGNAKKRN